MPKSGTHNDTVSEISIGVSPDAALVADVFITDAFARRPVRPADHQLEKHALQDLAARMLDHPEEVLPRFVEQAMAVTGGSSAGLSLYEADPAPGVFRWHAVCGEFARFDGATTPRDNSPCGMTLDCAGPVLARHPERLYDWIAAAGLVVPEVLLVPFYLGGPDPLGTLWIVGEDAGHFDQGHARAATELAGFVGTALRMQRDREQLSRALERQEMLAREMSHRVTNLFAVTDGMIRFGAKSARDKDDLARTLSGRLRALAAAHALACRTFDASGAETILLAPDLVALVRAVVVAPYQEEDAGDEPPRVVLDGPVVALGRHAANGLALVLHELATNASKYGALATGAGRVLLRWQMEEDELVLRWQESGGPPVTAAPAREGFGGRLLHGTVVRQLGGALERSWTRDGLCATIAIPADKLTA